MSALVIKTVLVSGQVSPPAHGLMQSYHNVTKLRQIRGVQTAAFRPSTGAKTSEIRLPRDPPKPVPAFRDGSAPASINLNVEVPDLLAQRIAVQPEQVGGADLVAAGGREGRGQ